MSAVLVLFCSAAVLVEWRSPSQGVLVDATRALFAVGVALMLVTMVLGLIATTRDAALRAATAALACFGAFWGMAIVLRVAGVPAHRPSVVASLPASFFLAMLTLALGTSVIAWWAERRDAPWRQGLSGRSGES